MAPRSLPSDPGRRPSSSRDARFVDIVIDHITEAEVRHDGYALSELDREFHLTIFQRARLATLEPILTRCALHVHRYTFGNGPLGVTPDNRTGLPSSTEQHRMVRNALATGDPEIAAQAMRDHIETIIGYWSPELLKLVRSDQQTS